MRYLISYDVNTTTRKKPAAPGEQDAPKPAPRRRKKDSE